MVGSAVVAEFATGLVAGEEPGALAAVAGADAGDVAALAAGDAADEVAASGCGPFAAGAADGDGLGSSEGARLPMFERSGPSRVFPINAGRSKM